MMLTKLLSMSKNPPASSLYAPTTVDTQIMDMPKRRPYVKYDYGVICISRRMYREDEEEHKIEKSDDDEFDLDYATCCHIH